jgi:hypothetical protein
VKGNRHSTGYCAKAVVTAIQKAKGQAVQGEGNAKDLGPFLQREGYRATGKHIGAAGNGDVAIFHAVRSHQYGHICMKCNGTWVSDFIQNGANPWIDQQSSDRYTVYEYGGASLE